MALTREERLEAARARSKSNIDNKNSFGMSGKSVIDWDKIGGFKKEYIYKPKAGMNHIDFVPFEVSNPQNPAKLKTGTPDYILDLWVHRWIGASKSTFICLERMYGKPCPICEAREKMKGDPDISDKEIKKLYPKRRCWYNVNNVDLPEKEQVPQIFEESHFLFESKFLEVVNVKNEFEFWDHEVGKTIEFMATEKTSPEGKHYEYSQFFFEKRPAYPDSIYDEAFKLDALLHIPTYDEVRNAFLDMDEEIPEPVVEEEEPPKRTRKREPEPEQPRRQRNLGEEIAEETKEQYEERPRRQRAEPPKEENKCPFGHKFGTDNDNMGEDCTKCDQKIWNECADEHDRLAGGK